MTPEEIRAYADRQAPRVNADWTINGTHVAIEATLRRDHGHPSFIHELDGPGRYRPTVRADALTADHVGLFVRSTATTIGVLLEVGGGAVWETVREHDAATGVVPADRSGTMLDTTWPGAVRLVCGLDAEVFRVLLVANAELTLTP